MKRILLVIALVPNLQAFSQTGMPDNTFGTNGKVITNVAGCCDLGLAIAVQSDGKIVVAGSTLSGANLDFMVIRYNSDGTIDNSFGGGDGIVLTDFEAGNTDEARGIAIQSDGKIVVAGYHNNGSNYDFAVCRYLSDGTLDDSFDGDGKQTTPIGAANDQAYCIKIQNDGKIVLAGATIVSGHNTFSLVRYNSDGSIDNSFDGDGKVTTDFGSLADDDFIQGLTILNDGKIIAVGTTGPSQSLFAIACYNSNGALDASFDGDGLVMTSFGTTATIARSVNVLSSGKILVVGRTILDIAIACYNSDGSLYSGFDGDGQLTTHIGNYSHGWSLIPQSNGKFIVTGVTSSANIDFLIVRYNDNGTIDASFGTNGYSIVDFGSNDNSFSSAITSNRIYLGGYTGTANTDLALAAFINDGFVLPVSMTAFNAVAYNNKIQLRWQTSSEQNSSSFTIERSVDGKNFSAVGTMVASGNATSVKDYVFTDAVPLQGNNFYRLKLNDLNGSFSYSKTVRVTVGTKQMLTVFPSPATDFINVQIKGRSELQITDVSGKLVKQFQKFDENTSTLIDVHLLPKGIYYLIATSGKEKEITSFVKL